MFLSLGGFPGFEGLPGRLGVCFSCGTFFIRLPLLICACALYHTWIEDNMQELGTYRKFRSLGCVASTLALSFFASSVRINLKHVINISKQEALCVR